MTPKSVTATSKLTGAGFAGIYYNDKIKVNDNNKTNGNDKVNSNKTNGNGLGDGEFDNNAAPNVPPLESWILTLSS